MLGANPQSLIYNLVLVLPGLLIVLVLTPSFAYACRLPDWSIPVLGVLNLVTAFCLFKLQLIGMDHFPLPGIGMILFLLTVGGAMLLGWFHSRPLMATPVPHVGTS